MKRILLMLAVALLAGCSASNIITLPTDNLIKISNKVSITVSGREIDANVLDQLTREIKGQLVIAGFDIDKESDNRVCLNVNVTEFNPGNAALRMTIGFGAGRGSLVYTAEYTNKTGQTLAKMDGEERFTGLEVSYNQHYGGLTTLGGEETATKVLLKEAAMHISQLAIKN
jgi:hypothetical protein